MSRQLILIKFLIKSLYEFIQLDGVEIKHDTFEKLTINIFGNEQVLKKLSKLYKAFIDTQDKTFLYNNENGEAIDIGEVNENIDTSYIDFNWYIEINKVHWFSFNDQIISSFFNINNFKTCLNSIDEFSDNNFFSRNLNIQIILPMYEQNDIIGYNFIISKELKETWEKPILPQIPNDITIKKSVHIMSGEAISFNLQKYYFNIQEPLNDLTQILLIKYTEILLSTLVQVFYSKNKVTIKGLRYFDLDINNNLIPDIKTTKLLEKSVEWAYAENTDTRIQLLVDRLSFYENKQTSFMEMIINYLPEVFEEAKSRYKFVITEKSEEYTKDLRDLLKDTKDKTDKYSEKTRNIISSLLRDTLGSIFFLGLTVYARFSNKDNFLLSNEAQFIFILLGFYFLLSMIFQAIFNFWDIWLSQTEANKWSESSMDYITKETYQKYVSVPLRMRTKQFIYVQVGVIFIYILLSLSSFFAQEILGYFHLFCKSTPTTLSPSI
jgi:hypothetical protein